MLLADSAAAAARFAPYSAMSALVYEDLPDCMTCQAPKLSPEDREFFENALRVAGWTSDHPGLEQPSATDSLGTYYRVWSRDTKAALEVVVAFRGTDGGLRDWINGNLRWLTRILPGEDQYQASRRYMGDILDYFKELSGRPANGKRLLVYTTGHSLGGGLAQNALYRYPDDVSQAFAFDPSPVTGFADNPVVLRRKGCGCRWNDLRGEARVYRVFERKEILGKARFVLKLALPLNRQIQEVRFDTGAGHSVAKLARYLIRTAGAANNDSRGSWFAGLPDSNGADCSQLYFSELENSCGIDTAEDYCPK